VAVAHDGFAKVRYPADTGNVLKGVNVADMTPQQLADELDEYADGYGEAGEIDKANCLTEAADILRTWGQR
jgi:hypothetical protein